MDMRRTFLLCIILMTGILSEAGGRGGEGAGEQNIKTLLKEPFIEPPLQQNISVLIGQTAYLRCVVKYVGDKTVSWVKLRDLHILTSATHIFTSDRRVSLLRESRSSWTLRLESVGKKDDSAYECQVNTEPTKIKLTIFLHVLGSQNDEWVPPLEAQVDYRHQGGEDGEKAGETRILGPSTIRMKLGEVLELTCLISHTTRPSPNITWFHSDVQLQGKPAGGLEIQTTKGQFTTVSKLRIFSIENSDVGKYSCGGDGLLSRASVSLIMNSLSYSESDVEAVVDGRLNTPLLQQHHHQSSTNNASNFRKLHSTQHHFHFTLFLFYVTSFL